MFTKGHPFFGDLSKSNYFQKGQIPWNKNKNKEKYPQLSKAGVKKGTKPWNTGTKGVIKPNLTSFKKGQKAKNWNGFKKGLIPWNKGKHWDRKTREKLSEAQFRRFEVIENHPRWLGGKSFEPYTAEFRNRLKERIRERDGRVCQGCGVKEGKQRLDIHHIDYDKTNCRPDNLIALCRRCNARVNTNRKYWRRHFQNKMV